MIDHNILIRLPYYSLGSMPCLIRLPKGVTAEMLEKALWETMGIFFEGEEPYNPSGKPVVALSERMAQTQVSAFVSMIRMRCDHADFLNNLSPNTLAPNLQRFVDSL